MIEIKKYGRLLGDQEEKCEICDNFIKTNTVFYEVIDCKHDLFVDEECKISIECELIKNKNISLAEVREKIIKDIAK